MMDWVADGCLVQVYDRLLAEDAFYGSGDFVIADYMHWFDDCICFLHLHHYVMVFFLSAGS